MLILNALAYEEYRDSWNRSHFQPLIVFITESIVCHVFLSKIVLFSVFLNVSAIFSKRSS